MDKILPQKTDIAVLYVEDEVDIRDGVTEMLKRRITNLLVASNGKEGLELYKEHKPQIIITDIRMPVMNGLDMAREIKAIQRNAQIIVTSAHSDINYFIESIDIGINQYVLKPINRDKLYEAIEKSINVINLERQVQQQIEVILKLYHAIEQSPSIVVITDTDGNIEYVNPRYSEITGYNSEDVIGKRENTIKESSNIYLFTQIWESLISGKEWKGEYLNEKKSGEKYWEFASMSPVKNAKGVTTSYVKVAEDITELKRYEQEIRVSEERYRSLVENLGEGICLVDFEENFTFANPAIHKIFGVPDGTLLGKNIKDFVDNEQFEIVKSQTVKRKRGERSVYELIITRHDGEKRTIIITATSQFDKENNTIGTIGIFQDITERKKLLNEIQKAKESAEIAYDIIEQKNKNITDSIKYAERIQRAILPHKDIITDVFKEAFVLLVPKDIVSGDFYWIEKKQNKVLFAAVDCTGHGVPGAFMSIIGSNLLNQAINEHNILKPSDILNYINIEVNKALRLSYEESSLRDGMDLALCCLDYENKKLEFAGANNPLYLLRNDSIIEYKADDFSIQVHIEEEIPVFNNNVIDLQEGDSIYIFSDGYIDQFGGHKRKKLLSKRFREILLNIKDLSMQNQKTILIEEFNKWKGNHEQIDDVLIIGIKI